MRPGVIVVCCKGIGVTTKESRPGRWDVQGLDFLGEVFDQPVVSLNPVPRPSDRHAEMAAMIVRRFG